MKHLRYIKFFITFFLILTTMSCDKKKNEFIPLEHMTFINSYYKESVKISYYILIDHSDSGDNLKKEIIQYAKQKLQHDKYLKQNNTTSVNFVFYKKTGNTSYFISHKENADGLLSEEISHYKEDFIANYYISKCSGGTMEKIYMYEIPEEIILDNCKK